ncbi:MAG: hypothetical protein LC624_03225, partial [Halobacteriales archaeon]|nr:hypothetical protein [Halobacteriales archaeon]
MVRKAFGGLVVACIAVMMVVPSGLLATMAAPLPALDGAGAHGLVPDATKQRFVHTWQQRLAQPGWFEAYMKRSDAVQDEFSALPKEHKQELARALFDDIAQSDPRLRADLAARGPEDRAAHVAASASVLYGILFDKDALAENWQPAPEQVAQEPASAPVRDPLTGEVLASPEALEARLAAQRTPGPVELPATLADVVAPPAGTDAPAARRANVVAPEPFASTASATPPWSLDADVRASPDASPSPKPADGGQGPALPDALRDILALPAVSFELAPAEVPVAVTPLPALAPLPGPTPDAVPADPVAFVQALTYVACGQMAGHAVVCSPSAIAFGVPVTLDLDQSPVTGLAGQEVAVELAPVLVPNAPPVPPAVSQATLDQVVRENVPPGVGVTLRVQDLDPTALVTGPHLPARVWVVYRVANPSGASDKVLRVGFDGLASTLPVASTALASVYDLNALLQGRLLARLNLTFDQPGASVAVFGEMSDGTGTERVTMGFTPPPSACSSDVDARLDGAQAVVQVACPSRPVADITYEAGTTRASARLDRLPSSASVAYQKVSDSETLLHYHASSTIGTVSATYATSSASSASAGSVTITSLPDDIVLDLQPGSGKGSA